MPVVVDWLQPVSWLLLLLESSQTFLQQHPGREDHKEVDGMRIMEFVAGREESRVKFRLVKERDYHQVKTAVLPAAVPNTQPREKHLSHTNRLRI